MKTLFKHIVLAFLLAGAFSTSRTPAGASLSPEPHYPRIASAVSRMMPVLHLYRMPVDEDSLMERVIDEYLTALDFDRAFFMASDIENFSVQPRKLLRKMQQGDIRWAYDVFDVFKKRVENRVQKVEALLDRGFDFSVDEKYAWKRRDAEWPRDEEGWDELWRLKIKHELLGHKVAAAEENSEPNEGEGDNPPDKEDDHDSGADDKENFTTDTTPEEHIGKRYRQYYLVLRDHDPEWVLQRFLSAFAKAFDPHSDYMSASADEDFDINMSLSLEGIGAQLTSEDGAAKVVRVIPGGPADLDGRLQEGDKIIAVAQEDEEPVSVVHWSLSRTVRLIRGPKGSRVVLVVIPVTDKTGSSTVEIELVRDEVRLEEQAARAEILDFETQPGETRRLGVISLPAFYLDVRGRRENEDDYRSSTRDVRKHIENMISEEVEGIVLDLRANGGGSLTEAVEMTGLFLENGPIVQVKERRGIQVLRDPYPQAVYKGPLVVLISRISASASEILSGALQDYGRAVIAGDSKTHGKGTVQTVVPIDRGDQRMGSLKVTAASFHRVDGRSTQQRGISSDVVIPSMLETMEIGEEYLRHPIPWSSVDPVSFRPAGDLTSKIPELQARSALRIEGCDDWQDQTSLLEQVRMVRDAEEISLKLDERMRLAAKESRLREIGIRRRGTGEEGLDLEADRVLRETLHVLSDCIEMGSAP